mmetsp:Transcript_36123/g.55139  ORF Transcript_36123/g.55139 Transcript_36123/m.55139 type:complete len:507 (+) Transcript_36123:98-1618(+)
MANNTTKAEKELNGTEFIAASNGSKRPSVQEELELLRKQRGMATNLKTQLFSNKGALLLDKDAMDKQRQQEQRQKDIDAVIPRGSKSAVALMKAALAASNSSAPATPPPSVRKKITLPTPSKSPTVLPLEEFHKTLKSQTQQQTAQKLKALTVLHNPNPSHSTPGNGTLPYYKYDGIDHRGFVFVVHDDYGLMLLHCTRKKKKGDHFQLPGGHVDDVEFKEAAKTYPGDPNKQLLHAAQTGAARELYEETGLDVRSTLTRLRPATLFNSAKDENEKKKGELECMLKHRLYFFLSVTDDDFWIKNIHSETEIKSMKLASPMDKVGSNLMIKLSEEHSGFQFIKDPKVSADLLKSHSKGVGREALLLAMNIAELDNHQDYPTPKKERSSKNYDNEEGDMVAVEEKKEHDSAGKSSSTNCDDLVVEPPPKNELYKKQHNEQDTDDGTTATKQYNGQDTNDGAATTKQYNEQDTNDGTTTTTTATRELPLDLLVKPKRKDGVFSCCTSCF